MNETERKAWRIMRAGKLTASRAHDILHGRPKKLRTILRDIRLEAEMVARGEELPELHSSATEWGTQWEPVARAEYELATGYEVLPGGFHLRGEDPLGSLVGASPDGLILETGGLECKCGFNPNTHISYVANGPSALAIAQSQFGMWVTARDWWHFVSFDPRHPRATRLYVTRIERDEEFIHRLAEKTLALAEHLLAGTDPSDDGEEAAAPELF